MLHIPQYFPDLFNKISVRERRDILCSSFIFPRTESLLDEPAINLEVETLDFAQILKSIDNDPEAIALCVYKDLRLILGDIQEVAEELCLDKFDSIQFYRNGLNVLRIQLKGNNCGRSVYLEINDYRRYLATPEIGWTFTVPQIAVGVAIVFGIAYICNIKM